MSNVWYWNVKGATGAGDSSTCTVTTVPFPPVLSGLSGAETRSLGSVCAAAARGSPAIPTATRQSDDAMRNAARK
jgi:hypothetical protein